MRFYLSHNETVDRLRALAQNDDVVFLSDDSNSSKPTILTFDDLTQPSSVPGFFCLAQKTSLKLIDMKFIEGQKLWTVDGLCAPVIEFMRGFQIENEMSYGRLYYESSYYSDYGKLVKKDEDFIKWAKKVFSRMKAGLEFDHGRSAYIGEEIKKARKEGLVLVDHH